MQRPESPGLAGRRQRRRVLAFLATVGVLVVATAAYVLMQRNAPPAPGDVAAATAFHVAVAALDADDLEHAAAKLAEVTRRAPAEAAAWANLALARMRQGELEGASEALSQAMQRAPDDPRIVRLAAALASRRGDRNAALEHLMRALELDPGEPRARYGIYRSLLGGESEDSTLRMHLDRLLEDLPSNLVLLLELAEVAVRAGNRDALRGALDRLAPQVPGEAVQAVKLLATLQAAAAGPETSAASTPLAFLRNVLKPTAAYRQDLAVVQIPFASVSEPLRRPLTLPAPPGGPAPPDAAMTFTLRAIEGVEARSPAALDVIWPGGEATPTVLAARGTSLARHDRPALRLPFPGGAGTLLRSAIQPVDLNNDFRPDLCLAGAGGLRILVQEASGEFADRTAALGIDDETWQRPLQACWALDLEADGDMDLVLASRAAPLTVLRNGGDGRFTRIEPLVGARGVTHLTWADLDADGDSDVALVGESGTLTVFQNERAGRFVRRAGPGEIDGLAALTSGDLDGDGRIELVALTRQGSLLRIADRGDGQGWQVVAIGEEGERVTAGDAGLWAADVDNNGAVDLVASGNGATRIWLGEGQGAPRAPIADVALTTVAVVDFDADGRLDLLGIDGDGAVVAAMNQSKAGYHWQSLRLRANPKPGDQRINAFAIGAAVEIRSAVLAQKRTVEGPWVHFGLGRHRSVDVVRMVWPNGAVQTAYDLAADSRVVAEQRLKGSCPFVFADDGDSMRFVTDFLWRSPLGLRINAQATAGVAQTQDRVRIDGSQLRARDGRYALRITAELWETHFFDHVSLLVVDHPPEVEALVDERFVIPPPELGVRLLEPPIPLQRVRDQHGRPVAELLRAVDERYVDGFELGRYQGVTDEHWIEFELDAGVPDDPHLVLVAQGWIYPTDSSINLAMAQGDHPRPHGLVLEVADGQGGWRVAEPDLGFPAGKRKTVLVPLGGRFVPGAPRRARLRSNLEIYWDAIGWSRERPDTDSREQRVAAGRADLRFRGYSRMKSAGRRTPELPSYHEIAGTGQRWRDLSGFHTRFGDVRELLAATDDRYVIMNAGDELVLEFPAPAPPPPGWQRDYVLIGDGWVKDGDLNTGFSSTVRPLPRHDDPLYAGPRPDALQDEPVFRRHAEDWQRFHTRFIAPDRFRQGLRPGP